MRLDVDRLGTVLVVLVTIGVLAPMVGLYASYWLNAASGATIVLVETAIFLVALLVRLQVGRRRETLQPAS